MSSPTYLGGRITNIRVPVHAEVNRQVYLLKESIDKEDQSSRDVN